MKVAPKGAITSVQELKALMEKEAVIWVVLIPVPTTTFGDDGIIMATPPKSMHAISLQDCFLATDERGYEYLSTTHGIFANHYLVDRNMGESHNNSWFFTNREDAASYLEEKS